MSVPTGVRLELTIQCAGRTLQLEHSSLTLSAEEGGVVEIDLGHGDLGELVVEGLPCGLRAGLEVKRLGPWGTVQLPGRAPQEFEVEALAITDADGRARMSRRALDRKFGAPPLLAWVGATGIALTGADRHRDGGLVFQPMHPVVVVESAAETLLQFGPPFATVAPAPPSLPSSAASHLRLMPTRLADEASVFVDGKFVGAVDLEAARANGSRCFPVEDLPWARGGGWLDINVFGAQGQDVRLELHKVGQPAGISAYGVLHPPFGVVLPEGGQGHGSTELAEWSLESNGALGASVRLPQGEYHAGIRLFGARPSSRNIVRLASVRVAPGRREALTLDLNAAMVWRVLPRPSYEGDPIDNGFLRIAGQAVHFSRDRDLARTLGEDGSSDALERSARFETFGETPTEAVLYSVGVEGEAVRLRGPDTSAERLHLLGQHAHLFAVLPTADRVYARLSRAFKGRLGGHLTGSSEAPHTYRDIPVNIPPEPTPVSEARRGVSVVVRGGAATGMITEVTREGRYVLRDWFTATPIGLHLLEGGRGRMIELVNEMGVPLIVALHPPRLPDMNLELFYASVIDAGRSCAVWVPDAVDAISWYEHRESTFAPYGPDARSQGGRALGRSSDLGTESLRLIAR